MENKICPSCGGIVIFGKDERDENGLCNQCQIKKRVMIRESQENKADNIRRWKEKNV